MNRFELLKVLTENGKKVDYIEEIIGPFLLKWLPEVITTGRYVCCTHHLYSAVSLLPPIRVSEYITLLVNMVHYNAAYLDDIVVSGLVM